MTLPCPFSPACVESQVRGDLAAFAAAPTSARLFKVTAERDRLRAFVESVAGCADLMLAGRARDVLGEPGGDSALIPREDA